MKSHYIWTPLLMAACAIVGVILGHTAGERGVEEVISRQQHLPIGMRDGGTPSGKVDFLLRLIDEEYVDAVNTDSITDVLIETLMDNLDPHSVYIPPKDLDKVNNELRSDFGGVGIQFTITDDTVRVVSVVNGGPSSHLGVQPGDKIIRVDGEPFTGDTITNEIVLGRLRGVIGDTVSITVLRRNLADATKSTTIDFDIVRDVIPQISVNGPHMKENGVGYMYIDRFAEKTYEEMMAAIAKLKKQGCQTLIIDLRSNEGGLLDVAINMCNEFLEDGDLILYTEGLHQPRQEFRANGLGTSKDLKLVVLIDEFSASASEIFAGAMQDNDRGTVIGRRSFGKGLVQSQIPLPDNSALRLTISRYHTPSGRCIQRPYDKGKSDYYEDIYHRFEGGELFEQDSVKFDETQMFTTKGGRTVFGGGGIMPDIFVPRDTVAASKFLYNLRASGIIYRYSLDYADEHRHEFEKMTSKEVTEKLLSMDFISDIKKEARKKDINVPLRIKKREVEIINDEVRAYIGRNVSSDEVYYYIINKQDPAVIRALKFIEEE